MKVISIGTCEFSEYETENIPGDLVLLVYDYSTGSYDGDGEAVGLDCDNRVHVYDLGHCSCYGPTDYMEGGDGVSIEDFLEVATCGSGNAEVDARFTEELRAMGALA